MRSRESISDFSPLRSGTDRSRNRAPSTLASIRPPMDDNLHEPHLRLEPRRREPRRGRRAKIEFDDETLRDGLQSPSVPDPSIEEKIRILHFMNAIGIDIGRHRPAGRRPHVQRRSSGWRARSSMQKLTVARTARRARIANDIQPIVEISQRVGHPDRGLHASSARRRSASTPRTGSSTGSSSSRRRRCASRSSEGLPVMYVTEDTTRAKPEDVAKLFTAAIDAGAKRVCVCDTVGHATPWGVRNLIRFVREVVDRVNPEVKIDWHGHNDRGLGVINSIAALEAGADRVHGTARGIGERVGNAPIDLLMVNLKLLGWIDHDLTTLPEYVRVRRARRRNVPLPDQYPVFGRDAFRTGTGVHAAAIIKAQKKGSEWLADRVYSGVPAGMFGLEQIIEVGPMCGLSNVIYWLDAQRISAGRGAGEGDFPAGEVDEPDSDRRGASRRCEALAGSTASVISPAVRPEWRNGRRSRLKIEAEVGKTFHPVIILINGNPGSGHTASRSVGYSS